MNYTESDLTPWYPPEIKPMREGVYERDMGQSQNGKYSYWNGDYWCGWGGTVGLAFNNRTSDPSMLQNQPWRGLNKEPK